MDPYTYIPEFVEDPDTAYQRLMTELDWVHVSPLTPRKEYYWHAQGLPYSYGIGRFAREYQSQPAHPVIETIGEKLTALTGTVFDVVFLNRYDDKRDHLGWHADDSPEMSDADPIVTISLGEIREIWFRPLSDLKNVTKLKLGHGSACIMLPGVQDTHHHRIPKCDHEHKSGARISLTFRKYVATGTIV